MAKQPISPLILWVLQSDLFSRSYSYKPFTIVGLYRRSSAPVYNGDFPRFPVDGFPIPHGENIRNQECVTQIAPHSWLWGNCHKEWQNKWWFTYMKGIWNQYISKRKTLWSGESVCGLGCKGPVLKSQIRQTFYWAGWGSGVWCFCSQLHFPHMINYYTYWTNTKIYRMQNFIIIVCSRKKHWKI